MRNLLISMAVAGVLLIGNTNPAEARSDVYVCTTENDDGDLRFDYYVDTDSIHRGSTSRGTGTLVDVDVYTIVNKTPYKKYHYRFSCNSGQVTYSINNGEYRLANRNSTEYTIYSFVLNHR